MTLRSGSATTQPPFQGGDTYIVQADPDHDVDDVAQVQGDRQLVAGGLWPVEHRGEESAAEFARCPGGTLVVVVVVVVVKGGDG